MAEQTAKKAAAKKSASSPDRVIRSGSYADLESTPDVEDYGTGKLARNVHLTGPDGPEVFEAGTEKGDLPNWAMDVLSKNPKAWEPKPDDEDDDGE